MKHAGRGEEHHGSWEVDVGVVEGADVLEVEHVPLDEGALDLLVGPVDEETVVLVRLVRQALRVVDGIVQVHPLPVRLEQNAELLRMTQGEHRNQHLHRTNNFPSSNTYLPTSVAAVTHREEKKHAFPPPSTVS